MTAAGAARPAPRSCASATRLRASAPAHPARCGPPARGPRPSRRAPWRTPLGPGELSRKAVASLKGQPGAAGPQGPAGPAGPATGPAGGDLTGNYPNPLIRPRRGRHRQARRQRGRNPEDRRGRDHRPEDRRPLHRPVRHRGEHRWLHRASGRQRGGAGAQRRDRGRRPRGDRDRRNAGNRGGQLPEQPPAADGGRLRLAGRRTQLDHLLGTARAGAVQHLAREGNGRRGQQQPVRLGDLPGGQRSGDDRLHASYSAARCAPRRLASACSALRSSRASVCSRFQAMRAVLLHERPELPVGEPVADELAGGGDRRRARALVDERDLAEVVARRQRRALPAADRDRRLARLDHEERRAARALLGDRLARGEATLLEQRARSASTSRCSGRRRAARARSTSTGRAGLRTAAADAGPRDRAALQQVELPVRERPLDVACRSVDLARTCRRARSAPRADRRRGTAARRARARRSPRRCRRRPRHRIAIFLRPGVRSSTCAGAVDAEVVGDHAAGDDHLAEPPARLDHPLVGPVDRVLREHHPGDCRDRAATARRRRRSGARRGPTRWR